MKRDYIIVVGAQGAGKSVWCKQFTAPHTRLLVYDPMGSYRVNFDWDDDTGLAIINDKLKSFRIGVDNPEDVPLLFNLAFAVGDCTLLVEECGTFFQRGKIEDWARRVVFMGRHRSVNVIFVAQRAASIPIDLRSQANRFVSFRQIEPDDCSAVSSIIGKSNKDKLPSLPDLRCIDWQNGTVVEYDLQITKNMPTIAPEPAKNAEHDQLAKEE